ncbi:hypothetical protein [Streptomyces cellostaticus]|uniref:hypothetical protein n=1 Tax=Streptomyces cellostaticus TaxID=67285 RepID=UPI000AFD94A3|nr:hypothetical protein [Streptomyces cellostaticus]GHI10041.1 hypothetical protein Scel_83620 [Streptomyces cellostaticus]
MARREGKRQKPFGLPESIALLATPDGRRHSIRTRDGGMVCGRLAEVPGDAEAGPGAGGGRRDAGGPRA